MNTSDIASEIYQEINTPTDVMTSTIIFWLNSNIGVLNLLLETEYTVSTTDNSITPAMGNNEKAIFKLLYERYYYNKLLNTTLAMSSYGGAGAIVQVIEGNRAIRLNAGTEVAKSYQSVVTGINGMLGTLVQAYKMSFTSPLQVTYDEDPYSLPMSSSINAALPYNCGNDFHPFE